MNKQRHSEAFDRFVDLICSANTCNEQLGDAEIDADLKQLGVDMEMANRRLHKMVMEQRARAEFLAAKQTRMSISDKIRDVVSPKLENLRSGIQSMIGKIAIGHEQVAYFHQLEKAASEADLQSLFDDIEKLAVIQELKNNDDSKSE